jgi:hypothetical protein
MMTHSGNLIKRFVTDNGLEFNNNQIRNYCDNKGIHHKFVQLLSPQSNSVVERTNYSLFDRLRTIFIDTDLDKTLWDKFLFTIAYLMNLTPKNRKTPKSVMKQKCPNLKHLHPIGCTAFIRIRTDYKLDSRGKETVFIGYGRNQNEYRFYDKKENRIISSRDARIIDELRNKENDCTKDELTEGTLYMSTNLGYLTP